MRKILAVLMAAAMLAALLCACGANSSSSAGLPADTVLTERMEAGMKALEESCGDDMPALWPEESVDGVAYLYPGIADVELKQFACYSAVIASAPSEVIMVEVADAKDVDTVKEIFQARIDGAASDTGYAEEAAQWERNAKVTVSGNFVFMCAMPDGVEVPAEFLAE